MTTRFFFVFFVALVAFTLTPVIASYPSNRDDHSNYDECLISHCIHSVWWCSLCKMFVADTRERYEFCLTKSIPKYCRSRYPNEQY